MWLQAGIASDGRATTVKNYSGTDDMKQEEAGRGRKFPGNERRGEQRPVVHVPHDLCILHAVPEFFRGVLVGLCAVFSVVISERLAVYFML